MKLSVRTLIGVVTSVFLLTAIATPASSAAIKIGFVFSMTGGAAVYGTSQKEGASLAIDQINAAAGSADCRSLPSSRMTPACLSRAPTCSTSSSTATRFP